MVLGPELQEHHNCSHHRRFYDKEDVVVGGHRIAARQANTVLNRSARVLFNCTEVSRSESASVSHERRSRSQRRKPPLFSNFESTIDRLGMTQALERRMARAGRLRRSCDPGSFNHFLVHSCSSWFVVVLVHDEHH